MGFSTNRTLIHIIILVTVCVWLITKGYASSIPVNIRLKSVVYLHDKAYVPTNTSFVAIAEITDERYKNLSMTYQWSVKNHTIITDNNSSQIDYKFTDADESNYLKLLVVHKPNDTGSCQQDFVIRDPLDVQQPKGTMFLEHGDLLRVQLNFKGTGPFKYCHKCVRDSLIQAPKATNATCLPDADTSENHINISQYLRVGNYSLVFVITNVASRVEKIYKVRVSDTVREHSNVPYIPLISSICAVLILMIGIVMHLRFKRTLHTETADFDFSRHAYEDDYEDWMDEERSFVERVRYLLFESSQSADPNLSGSRSRLT